MKAYYSNYTKQVNKGQESEDKFELLAKKEGFKVKKATKKENKILHIDFYISKVCHIYSVDVKTVGKYGYTSEIQTNWGGLGSLFGEADYMAYVDGKIIRLVNRVKLVELVKSKIVEPDNIHDSSEAEWIDNPYYKIFQRKSYGWSDEWIMIPSIDILDLVEYTWSL